MTGLRGYVLSNILYKPNKSREKTYLILKQHLLFPLLISWRAPSLLFNTLPG
jgi:hypothetical protein